MNILNSSQLLVEALSVASVAAISYVSTNFDNLAILSVFTVKPGYRSFYVRMTFVLVCVTVLLVSLLLAKAAASSGLAGHIRYLGLIPVGLGLFQLLRLMLDRTSSDGADLDDQPAAMGFPAYVGFALVLLANSGDSVSVMTPLLADLKPTLVLASFGAAMIVAMAMTWFANILTRHPVSRATLEKLAKWALPFLLIVIGVLILTNQPSDIFVG